MIRIRKPGTFDTRDMAKLLNEIIAEGGTTAHTNPVTAEDITQWISATPDQSAWHVAVNENEQVVGFQWIEPHPKLPPEAADISTFVKVGQTGLGVGSALFAATEKAAKALGYKWINANIRADNEGGLIYYQSRGFEDYGEIKGYRMANGQMVDKRLKRFDL